MIRYLKKITKWFVGTQNMAWLYLFKSNVKNYNRDFILYYKYSTVFSINSFQNIEAKIIIDYHALEKGMLHANMKPGFAAERIHRLHIYLSDPAIKLAVNTNTQILVAYQVMCKY